MRDEFRTDEDGNAQPVHNCSMRRFELLKDIDPDSEEIRNASPGFCQELYKAMKKGRYTDTYITLHCISYYPFNAIFYLFVLGLSQAADMNSRSGQQEGTFDTPEGTDYYAKFCQGVQWVELGCFVGFTLPDMRSLGKLLPDEWYSVDAGRTQNPGYAARNISSN